jgi:hypothetical protein
MAAVLGWGLWNPRLTEWFNPGGKRPYFPSREAAERMLQSAMRQYSVGKWELREFLAEEEPGTDPTDRLDAERPDTETLAAPRRAA